jgi:hypothetical protein
MYIFVTVYGFRTFHTQQQATVIYLNDSNRSEFVMQTQFVFCEEVTKSHSDLMRAFREVLSERCLRVGINMTTCRVPDSVGNITRYNPRVPQCWYACMNLHVDLLWGKWVRISCDPQNDFDNCNFSVLEMC